MKKIVFLLSAMLLVVGASAQRQIDTLAKYQRSSLYSVLIKHTNLPYGTAIDSAFMLMPIPDKFNDHNLPVRSFESTVKKVKKAANNKKKDAANLVDIQTFFEQGEVGKALVSKWFNRDDQTGYCNMDLISERGFYDASQLDIRLAENSIRGKAQLADAGEKLIGNTYVLVNDITFIDRGNVSSGVATGLSIFGKLASAVTGVNVEGIANTAAKVVNDIDGFKVNVTSYLYRLSWDEDVLMDFYNNYYVDASTPKDQYVANRNRFNAATSADSVFALQYIGKTTTSAANLSSKVFASQSKEQQMLKVCTRAIDKSIVQLQREYDEFKVNVPIHKINDDGTVDVEIGLKEGVNVKSTYDVLMPTEDENGRLVYNKVGSIRPVEGKIWDNRFGALEDAEALAQDKDAKPAEGEEAGGDVNLTATTFKITSGEKNIVPGCLVREATIKSTMKK